MPEPLILKVQADVQGVPENFNKVTRTTDNLDFSTRKASSAMKGFVQDLAQARDGADVASAALGAFSKILGTSLAATGVVIAGKTIIDSFQKVSTIVSETRDKIEKASSDIKKSGLDVGFSQAAGEARKLSDESENARASIEKLDKSFLMGLIATITGAREELGKLAQDADRMAQQRLFEGARAERIRAEERVGLEGAKLQIKDIEDRMTQELKPFNLYTKAGRAGAAEVVARADIEKEKVRQKVFDEFDRKQAQQELKNIEAKISGAEAAAKIARESDREAAKQAEESIKKLEEERAKAQEKLQKDKEKSEENLIKYQEKQLDAQDRVNDARRKVVEADAKVADILIRGAGTGRGLGQRATSAEIGAQRAAERAGREETAKQREQAYKDFKLMSEVAGQPSDKYAFNRAQAERLKEQEKQKSRAPFEEQKRAKDNLKSSETYLSNIEKLLSETLEDLKSYAMVK